MTQQGIPTTARAPVEWTPPALQMKADIENDKAKRTGGAVLDAPKILIRVPTPYERDAWGAALVRGGVVHYSKKQVRDAFLAGLSFLIAPDKYDEAEYGMQQLWAYVDAQEVMHQQQTDRYLELQEANFDLPDDKKLTEQQIVAEAETIKATVEMSAQQRVQLVAIQLDIQQRYEPLRTMMADLAEQESRTRWLSVETYVVGWTGLAFTPIGNGRGGITRTEAEWLHRQIGSDAFNQAADLIFSMHGLDGDEEKNLASLIESSSALTGSTAAESMAIDGPGTSTGEPSTGTPDTESQPTTD